MSSTNFAHVCKSSEKWDKAISDAEGMIREAKERIAQLKSSVKTFKRLRDRGAPFPGESADQSEAASQ